MTVAGKRPVTGFGISGVTNLGLMARGFISYFIQAYQEGVLNSNLVLHTAGVRLTFGVHVSTMRVSPFRITLSV